MSSEIAIRVENLSKCYQIYEKPRDRLLQMAMRGKRQYYKEFWALKDVSFEVEQGETVGIVGRNGSGKSTLLQLICGTLNPTAGGIQTNGRIAALLELGSGFNPEFTGQENVYMNAAVLGLSQDEIEARFDSIEAFADIGAFMQQPVKMYSSGMVVRLAFAVAINVDPQILVVDEALSVGDEVFQRKCFSRIETIKASGSTILFVSHAGGTVVELCDRALLIDQGELLTSGEPKNIIGKYQKLLYAPEDKRAAMRQEIQFATDPFKSRGEASLASKSLNLSQSTVAKDNSLIKEQDEFFDPHLHPQSTISYEPHGALIISPQILTLASQPVNCLKQGKTYRYTYTVQFESGATNVRFGMLIKTLAGVELGGGVSAPSLGSAIAHIESGSEIKVEFRFQCILNPGIYFLNAGVVGVKTIEETYLHRILDAVMFRVLPTPESLATGVVCFNCTPDISLITNQERTLVQ